MGLPEESTLPPQSLSHSGASLGPAEAPALVLVWSREEPQRVGEALLFPPSDRGPWTFGRDGGEKATTAPRTPRDGPPRAIHLVRQRPGENEPTGPLENPRISRAHLEVRRTEGGLTVRNAGRTSMLTGDGVVESVTLSPGDAFELRHEMVFLCVLRPAVLPACEGIDLHPFGRPDSLGITGESPAIWALRRALHAVARRPSHALILGESGTGKELVARAIHACSPRSRGAFVARSAATLPEGVLDAELFGSARGFPNAGSPERPGLVGEADGGTLFLDEIGELPEAAQAHLLRVLDGGEYHRLGESRARKADLRLVAATNRPESALKHDVLARLTARIQVPGLDARREDIPLLVRHLLRRQAAFDPGVAARLFPESDLDAAPRVAPELLRELVRHPYETHLRELDALLLAATLEGTGRYAGITPSVLRLLSAPASPHLPARPSPSPPLRGLPTSPGPSSSAPPKEGGQALAGGAFSPDEERRLVLLRTHGFRPAACAKDPRYGANRQSADFHLRHLIARALAVTDYRIAAAEELLAGPDPLLRERIHERVTRTLDHLRERLKAVGREALSRSLTDEWRGSAQVALALLAAVESGAVR